MWTGDLARRVGCSVQQVRKLEAVGVLPSVARTMSGYRIYGEQHETSLRAYRALAVAVGPLEARLLMTDAHRDRPALRARLDAAHARLHQEREELALARQAVIAIGAEPMADVRPTDALSVGELAGALGLRPSTLRHWEAEGLLAPGRTAHRKRMYSPTDVRDARLIHQLRQAGYRIAPLRELLPHLRDVEAAAMHLTHREHSIDSRSDALLQATVALATALVDPTTCPSVDGGRATPEPDPEQT
jgi:DNA-binding transcriptional MerR regulator